MRALAPEVLLQVRKNSRRRARLQPFAHAPTNEGFQPLRYVFPVPSPNFSAACLAAEVRFPRLMGQSHVFSRLGCAVCGRHRSAADARSRDWGVRAAMRRRAMPPVAGSNAAPAWRPRSTPAAARHCAAWKSDHVVVCRPKNGRLQLGRSS